MLTCPLHLTHVRKQSYLVSLADDAELDRVAASVGVESEDDEADEARDRDDGRHARQVQPDGVVGGNDVTRV